MTLLAALAALPFGQKVPVSRFARELNCSTAVLLGELEQLVRSGAVDVMTLRPVAPVAVTALPQDGQALFAALVALAKGQGLSNEALSIHLFGNKARVYSIRTTKRVKPATLAICQGWADSLRPVEGTGSAAAAVGAKPAAATEAEEALPARSAVEHGSACDAAASSANPPRAKIDLNRVPSGMEQAAEEWRSKAAGSAVPVGKPATTFLGPKQVDWCNQCDQRVSGTWAAQCRSLFCKMKVRAA